MRRTCSFADYNGKRCELVWFAANSCDGRLATLACISLDVLPHLMTIGNDKEIRNVL